MTDQQKIAKLREVLAELLRQTADPDPTHPAYQKARRDAAIVFHQTA